MQLTTRIASTVLGAIGDATWRLVTGVAADNKPTIPAFVSDATPRHITSACPWCHARILNQVLAGTMSESAFEACPAYIVPAQIIQRDGRIWMQKVCPEHGLIEDLLSSDAAFTARMESLYSPQDSCCEAPRGPHRKATGVMLVIDLTNRCNMKCSPCFMDANHHPYVREATLEDVRKILERAADSDSRRDQDILFSGGEPTISQVFLDCLELAKSMGFGRLHVATNGIRFAQEPAFARACQRAGLQGVYLQFDGVSSAANAHRGVSNLFDVKVAALDHIHAAGLSTVLQVTVTNNANNSEIGKIVDFAVESNGRVRSVLFQPLVFTGRDQLPDDADRAQRRYTLAHLAHDLQDQSKFAWLPLRDWFPVSASGAFGNVLDALGLQADLRSPAQDLHATHGQFSVLLIDTKKHEAVPLSSFFLVDQFLQDAAVIARQSGSPLKARVLLTASILRNLRLQHAPSGLALSSIGRLFRQLAGRIKKSREDVAGNSRWQFLVINAMWFRDPFNVDFESVCRSCAPVATEEGEFSFCAYKTMGWRQIVESRHQTADLSRWHRQNGRHTIYANGATVPLEQLTASRPTPEGDKDLAQKAS
jgi:uncharacterized radical SAM superfamily Fe-S cluster-containing enzyme